MNKRRASGTTGSSIDLQQMMQQAVLCRRNGQVKEALQIYRRVLQREPHHAEAKCGAGQAIARTGNISRGIQEVKEAISLHPDDSSCHAAMAELFLMAGDIENASQHAEKSTNLNPKNPSGFVIRAQCSEMMHKTEEALEIIEQALRLAPGDPFPLSFKARFQTSLKDYEGAKQTLDELTKSPSLYPSLAPSAWNSLGKVLDKLGDYDGAYRAFVKCGYITKARSSLAGKCDPRVRLLMIEAMKKGFTAERVARYAGDQFAWEEDAPAFLVGFPRSGTTMTEQIMAAHPSVITTDEKPFMNAVRSQWAKLVGGGNDVGEMLDRTTEEHVRTLRKCYWDHVESSFGSRCEDHLLVDKLPLNINNIGLINLIFPDAKIIVALRDPRDVCLSCFMQDFRLNNAMIHFLTLEGTVSFYARVMDLYLHNRDIMTLDFIQVRYEDTVTGLKAQAERILQLLNLDWDDSVLRFYEKAREKYISTPSYTAVTEPVHTRAVKRWVNYESYFENHQQALARFVHEFGYD